VFGWVVGLGAGEHTGELGRRQPPCGQGGDETAVMEAAAEIDRTWGRVDALINNAGWMPPRQPIIEMELSLLERVMRSNVIGSFLTTKHLAPLMIRSGGGRIV
jgi:NAD(P)-dependent dehydrogenase (short-subunit alcohol dehydrogenase family)